MDSNDFVRDLPEKIRVSVGSAAVIGLLKCKLDVSPTTVHLMTYHKDKCVANCGFCPQAKQSSSKSILLSRISWPEFKTRNVFAKLDQAYQDRIISRVSSSYISKSDICVMWGSSSA